MKHYKTLDIFEPLNSFNDAVLSELSTGEPVPKAIRVKKPPIVDLSTAINPLIDNELIPVNQKKSTNKKSSSPSSLARHATVTSSSLFEKGDELNTKNDESKDDYDKLKDSVIAEHLTRILQNTLCFDDVSNEWYLHQKWLWQTVSKKRATKAISKALSAVLPDGYSMSKLNSIEAFLTLNLLVSAWESRRNLLPMQNGILDTNTGTLITARDQYRFNWQLPYCFEPDTQIQVIDEWLNDATGGDAEAINIIRAFFKMALIGGEVQKFLELIGPGGTGKSTLARLLVAFIGEHNQVTTDLKNLEGNRFEAAALYGKRLALINDSSRYGGEVSTLKAITGGDPIRYERKNQQQGGSFVYKGVVVVASNEAIQTADYTSGLIRRRMPVVFNRKVTDEDKEKWASLGGIEAAMKKELPGLLNWVLAMTDDEVKAVIGGINGEMTRTQREHLIDTNKIAEWLNDNTVIIEDAVTYVGKSTSEVKDVYETDKLISEKLYSNYERWCRDSNYHPVAFNRFSANVTDICEQLKIKIIKDKNKHGAYLRGIAIRNDSHSSHPMPVTKAILNDSPISKNDLLNTKGDELIRSGDEPVTNETRANDSGDDGDDIKAVVEYTVSLVGDRGRI
ncbi:MAG: phage/plasmid primase, P4 family [Methylococcales bacterium]|nr:phage/plasmid primase, P4 family [Methylococcales bacterium]